MTIREAGQMLKGYRHQLCECAELKKAYENYTRVQWRDTDEYRQKAGELFTCWLIALTKAQKEIETAEKVLECLPALERRILRLYYFQGETWKEVASQTKYSEEHVKGYLRRNALALFAVWWPRCIK